MDTYEEFNIKRQLDAETFVDNNFLQLCQLYNVDDEMDNDEKRQVLVDYFQKYPDQISSYSIRFFGNNNTLRTPTTNNIGGTIKYH